MDFSVSICQQYVSQLETTVQIWQLLGLSIELVVQVVRNERLHKSLEEPVHTRQVKVIVTLTPSQMIVPKVHILSKSIRNRGYVVVTKSTLPLPLLRCTLV